MTEMISIRLTPDKAGDNIGAAVLKHPRRLRNLLAAIVEVGKTRIVERTPTGWSAALRGGYTAYVRWRARRPQGIIANPVLYHDFVEGGRAPGRMPPVAAIMPWVATKLGVPPGPARLDTAWAVAKGIAAAGTDPQRMVELGWKQARREIRPYLAKHGLRVTRDIGGRR